MCTLAGRGSEPAAAGEEKAQAIAGHKAVFLAIDIHFQPPFQQKKMVLDATPRRHVVGDRPARRDVAFEHFRPKSGRRRRDNTPLETEVRILVLRLIHAPDEWRQALLRLMNDTGEREAKGGGDTRQNKGGRTGLAVFKARKRSTAHTRLRGELIQRPAVLGPQRAEPLGDPMIQVSDINSHNREYFSISGKQQAYSKKLAISASGFFSVA